MGKACPSVFIVCFFPGQGKGYKLVYVTFLKLQHSFTPVFTEQNVKTGVILYKSYSVTEKISSIMAWACSAVAVGDTTQVFSFV